MTSLLNLSHLDNRCLVFNAQARSSYFCNVDPAKNEQVNNHSGCNIAVQWRARLSSWDLPRSLVVPQKTQRLRDLEISLLETLYHESV